MIDSLNKIKEAEKKAVEQMDGSKKGSSEMLVKAEDDAKGIIKKASDDAGAKAEELMKKACSDAQAEAEKIIQEGLEASQAIKASGEGKISSAAKVIVSQVTGEA
jgi:vacuolar-type H+-ATPase subunit H